MYRKNEVYSIAEIGINHNGDIKTALELIKAAKESGASAVKFQTYITEKRVSKDSKIFDILKKCELNYEEFSILRNFAKEINIDFFSTPFDKESVDLLESLDVSVYKIASFDIVNKELLRYVSNQNKLVIISTGMSNLQEINEAYDILSAGKGDIGLLHCVSSYPTLEEDSNLLGMKTLGDNYPGAIIGLSDHTNDIKVPIYAVCLGARIIEKHFMLENQDRCIDKPVSINPLQFKKMTDEFDQISKILGNGIKEIQQTEEEILQYRRYSN